MTVNMAEFRQVVEKLGEMGDVVATLQRNTQDLYQEATVNKTQSTAAIDNLRREIIDKCNAGIDDAAAKIVDLQNKTDFLNVLFEGLPRHSAGALLCGCLPTVVSGHLDRAAPAVGPRRTATIACP